METAIVESVNVGRVETFDLPDGDALTSAIRKTPQEGPVEVTPRGFAGDATHGPEHGGPNRALHVFCREHIAHFEAEHGRPLPVPLVGENLTVRGHPDAEAHVGDVVRAGTALLQVTMPTERCRNPGRVAGVPLLLKWMIESLRTGYYLRVVEPGVVAAGDAFRLEERGNPRWSIEALSRAMLRDVADPDLVASLLDVPEIAPEWKTRLELLHARRNRAAT